MTRAVAAVVAVVMAGAFVVRGHHTAPPTGALAVLGTHVAYESSLVGAALPRLPAGDVTAARDVGTVVAAQASQLSAALARRGYSPARAHAEWARLIGDGTPPPSRVLLYVCSVHAASDTATLGAAPPAQLGNTLAAIELTLLVEGQQLSRQVGGSLGAHAAAEQRHALHLLAPLLVASDRAYASAA
jgi:hypothetical protein